jgi:release factor glutamine methyltransferase
MVVTFGAVAIADKSPVMRIVTPPGVFRPISDTWMLADVLREQTVGPRASVVDVCTGSGALAICAALRGARDVTALDVSRKAVLTARLNARLNGVRVRARRSDLLSAVAGRRFDVIVSNPPYVPAERDELPERGLRRAWDAGRDGRLLLDRLIDEAPAHLKAGGVLLVTHSSIIGVERTCERMAAAGLEPDVPLRRRGPLGPLMSARVRHLEEQGMLAPDRREEVVVVIRGRAKAARPAAAPRLTAATAVATTATA